MVVALVMGGGYLHVWVEEEFIVASFVDVLGVLEFVGWDKIRITDCVDCARQDHQTHDRQSECVGYFRHSTIV